MPLPVRKVLYLVSNALIAAARIIGATAFIVSVFKNKPSKYHKRDRDNY